MDDAINTIDCRRCHVSLQLYNILVGRNINEIVRDEIIYKIHEEKKMKIVYLEFSNHINDNY